MKQKTKHTIIYVVALILLIILAGCGAEGLFVSTDLYGTITAKAPDSSLLPLQGVEVSVDNLQVATTDDQGDYILFNLTEGDHTVKVELPGFQTYEDDIAIIEGEDYRFDYTMVPEPNQAVSVGTVNIHNSTGYLVENTSAWISQDSAHAFSVNNNFTDNRAYQPDEIIIKYRPMVTRQAGESIASAQGLSEVKRLAIGDGRIVCYRIPGGRSVEEMVDYFNQQTQVEWAEPNYLVHATAVPNDPLYGNAQWGHVNVNLEAAWDQGTGSAGVVVAVIDTGIIPNHEDLAEHIILGTDYVDGDKPYDTTPLSADGSHGTHVAGIIGAVTGNGTGVSGVNWDVSLLILRVLGPDGAGSVADVADAIESAVAEGVHVINLSLGLNTGSQTFAAAVDYAADNDVTVVASAGNNSSPFLLYPAAYSSVISVGSVTYDNRLSSFSNYGYDLDLVAPGGGAVTGDDTFDYIWSTWGYYENGNFYQDYWGMRGTSMAAPYVSGVAALVMATENNFDPDFIRYRLKSTAVDLGDPYYYGAGLVDAYAAILGHPLPKPVVFASAVKDSTQQKTSDVVEMNDDGSFILTNVVPGDWYLMAWRDVDGDGIANVGDYLGVTDTKLQFEEGRVTPGDIDIYYVGKESSTYIPVP